MTKRTLRTETEVWTSDFFQVKVKPEGYLTETFTEPVEVFWGISDKARDILPFTDEQIIANFPQIMKTVHDYANGAMFPDHADNALELILNVEVDFKLGGTLIDGVTYAWSLIALPNNRYRAFIACITVDEFHSYREERKPMDAM